MLNEKRKPENTDNTASQEAVKLSGGLANTLKEKSVKEIADAIADKLSGITQSKVKVIATINGITFIGDDMANITLTVLAIPQKGSK